MLGDKYQNKDDIDGEGIKLSVFALQNFKLKNQRGSLFHYNRRHHHTLTLKN